MDKSVSIIIPTYNRKHTLVKVIDSYLYQGNVKEIIFVNDGSTDGTYEHLKRFQTSIKTSPIIKIEGHPIRLGASQARNTGINVATGDYIMIGEDDVVLKEDYISTLLKCIKWTGAGIIAGRILYSKEGESFDETVDRCSN